jgi:hypothetical protein
MSGKPKDYLWAFIIGGLLSVLCEGVLLALRMIGVPYGLSLTLAMAIMAAFGFVATIAGVYEKWEALGGMGLWLPFTCLPAVIIEITGAQLAEGKSFREAAFTGLRGCFWIFGLGVPFCMIAAVITHLIQAK